MRITVTESDGPNHGSLLAEIAADSKCILEVTCS